jgi:hypothetical protein
LPYGRLIQRWEYKLATRDCNRVVRPFEWGLEWLEGARRNGNPARDMAAYTSQSVARSAEFFSPPRPVEFRFQDNLLTFESALPSPYPENNTVYADFFPAENDRGRAVVVLPQWNSDINGHVGLCRLLNRFGITALRMSMAYHDRRMPAELERADYHVSSNVGRTIHAARQSIIDTRCCVRWLKEECGYKKVGVLGSSLGSCMAFIAAAHEPHIDVGVFNHVSTYFSDVVWTGLSTRHVREGFEGHVTQDELRQYWGVISPATYFDRMKSSNLKTLLVWARYDTTFLPVYSRQVIDAFRERDLRHSVVTLPCAHYTTGEFPFKWLDGLSMCRFLYKEL